MLDISTVTPPDVTTYSEAIGDDNYTATAVAGSEGLAIQFGTASGRSGTFNFDTDLTNLIQFLTDLKQAQES